MSAGCRLEPEEGMSCTTCSTICTAGHRSTGPVCAPAEQGQWRCECRAQPALRSERQAIARPAPSVRTLNKGEPSAILGIFLLVPLPALPTPHNARSPRSVRPDMRGCLLPQSPPPPWGHDARPQASRVPSGWLLAWAQFGKPPEGVDSDSGGNGQALGRRPGLPWGRRLGGSSGAGRAQAGPRVRYAVIEVVE